MNTRTMCFNTNSARTALAKRAWSRRQQSCRGQ